MILLDTNLLGRMTDSTDPRHPLDFDNSTLWHGSPHRAVSPGRRTQSTYAATASHDCCIGL